MTFPPLLGHTHVFTLYHLRCARGGGSGSALESAGVASAAAAGRRRTRSTTTLVAMAGRADTRSARHPDEGLLGRGVTGTSGELVRVETRVSPAPGAVGGTLMRVLPVRGGRYGGPPSICRLHRIGRWKSPLGNIRVAVGVGSLSRKQGADVPRESSICKAALKSANGEFSG